MTNQDDNEETVVIGRQKTQGGVYHTRECNTYPDNEREITLGEARRRGLHECKVCAREVDHSSQGGPILANIIGSEDFGPEDLDA